MHWLLQPPVLCYIFNAYALLIPSTKHFTCTSIRRSLYKLCRFYNDLVKRREARHAMVIRCKKHKRSMYAQIGQYKWVHIERLSCVFLFRSQLSLLPLVFVLLTLHNPCLPPYNRRSSQRLCKASNGLKKARTCNASTKEARVCFAPKIVLAFF